LISSLKKIFYLLTVKDRKKFAYLILLTFFFSIFELISIASILPFITVLTKPELIETNLFLSKFFYLTSYIGVANKQQFIFILGLIFIILFILSIVIRSTAIYLQIKFVQMQEYSIGRRLVEGQLSQSYRWFLKRHSADLGKNILSDVLFVIANGIKPCIEIISKSLITILIIIFLFLINPQATLILGLLFFLIYGSIFFIVKKIVGKLGKERMENNHIRSRLITEFYGGIKQIKINRLEKIYIRKFSDLSYGYARNTSLAYILGVMPRYLLEAFTLSFAVMSIIFFIGKDQSFIDILPLISVYIFSGFRLLPMFQQIYNSLVQLTFVKKSVDNLNNEFKNLDEYEYSENDHLVVLPFNEKISLKNVCFNYPGNTKQVLSNLNLDIAYKSTIGIMGATGSGKTTIIDIINGLLKATHGTLEIDGKVITAQNKSSWQKNIGYVSQDIFLNDDTIIANIAMNKDIDLDKIIKVCKVANIHNFIKNLPQKYHSLVGERGKKLSGGQIQRIGIARALYNDRKVLILDEATSALDDKTQNMIMEAIQKLKNKITIILISHRLEVFNKCDIVYKIDKGEIKKIMTFPEIIKN